MRGAISQGVCYRVREHEPTLGVGVEDLDRLAVRTYDNVPWALSRWPDHVLGRGYDCHDIQRNLASGNNIDRSQHGCGTCHVRLHLAHRWRLFQRDAAGVECDALADKSTHCGIRL